MKQNLSQKSQQDKPCKHMESLLNHTAKGSAGRFARWYALAHVARCGPCRRFLQRLEVVLEALKSAKSEEPSNAKADEMMQKFLDAKKENP